MPTVTLSSIGTVVAALDYLAAKATTFAVTASTSGTWNYTVQATLDPPQTTVSPTWFLVSSVMTAASSLGLIQGPLAGLRLNSTTNGGTLTLYYLQNSGG